jgi:hypothetical protein
MELGLQDMKIIEVDKYTPVSPKNAYWEVVYDYSGSYSIFLTEDEKNTFLRAISEGNDFYETRGLVLSKRFLLIRFAHELKHKEDKQNMWNHSANVTRKVVEQMDAHFKKNAEQRKMYEAKD